MKARPARITPTQEILSDEEIERVHANANFGTTDKRRVVEEGVLKYAMGYTSGATQLAILVEHKLVRRPRGTSYHTTLTDKGQDYLRAMTFRVGFSTLLDFLSPESVRV